MKDRLVSAGYAAGWTLTKALPHPVAAALFRLGADRAYKRQGRRVQQLAANLRRVVPDADEAELASLTRTAMRSYGRYWLETFRLPVMNKAEVARRVVVDGYEHVDTAYSQGRGVIIALPHIGNWDVAGVWLIDHIAGPFTTVVERLKPDSLYERFAAYREGLGMEVLPVNGGESAPSDVLRTRLKEGRIICLVSDRDLSTGGIPVTFFGEQTKMPAGSAVLAATTGAALIPCAIWFDAEDWRMRFHSRLLIPTEGRLREKVVATTQRMADVFAGDIASHPADWHMLQPLWLDDLTP